VLLLQLLLLLLLLIVLLLLLLDLVVAVVEQLLLLNWSAPCAVLQQTSLASLSQLWLLLLLSLLFLLLALLFVMFLLALLEKRDCCTEGSVSASDRGAAGKFCGWSGDRWLHDVLHDIDGAIDAVLQPSRGL